MLNPRETLNLENALPAVAHCHFSPLMTSCTFVALVGSHTLAALACITPLRVPGRAYQACTCMPQGVNATRHCLSGDQCREECVLLPCPVWRLAAGTDEVLFAPGMGITSRVLPSYLLRCGPQVPIWDMPPGVTAPALPAPADGGSSSVADGDAVAGAGDGTKVRFTWRLENLAAFRSILEQRKVFSRCARL